MKQSVTEYPDTLNFSELVVQVSYAMDTYSRTGCVSDGCYFKFVRRGTNNLFCEWKHIFSYGSGPSIENMKQHLTFLLTIADI